jgi:hypothetical protein
VISGRRQLKMPEASDNAARPEQVSLRKKRHTLLI